MTQPLDQLSAPTNSEFLFTDANFTMIAEIAKRRFGLDLQPSKKPLVYSRLAKRLRKLNLDNFDDYCAVLDSNDDTEETGFLLSALTTNVTHFFRENHHFVFLKDVLAPKLIARAKAGDTVRIWSAACSAGQEAYSIAAALLQVDPQIAQSNLRILATDIDPQMIAVAKQAQYPIDQKAAIPSEFRNMMLQSANSGGPIVISDKVRSLVTFAELNLIEPWPMRRQFDVIFCRNAAIYFDKKTQSEIWSRFANCLVDGGHLMIGHSERLSGDAQTVLQSAGITTYTKKSTV